MLNRDTMRLRLLLAGRHGTRARDPALAESPGRWLGRAQQWVEGEAAGILESARFDVDGRGHPVLALRLHPAAEDVSIVTAENDRVVVAANTFSVGPGYHRYVCELMKKLGDALDVEWMARDEAQGLGDPTGYFETGDACGLEQQMLGWLAGVAEHALDMSHSGQPGVAVSLRFGHHFESAAPLLTPMGPRDLAWLETVRADPSHGADVFPWWTSGTGSSTQLGRALTQLWTDVVWRPPLLEDERRLLRGVAARLESAFKGDPSLAYPWTEWRELLAYLGKGGTIAEEVSRRAALEDRAPSIGYRRGPLRVDLRRGWSIRIPGSLAEERLPDGRWVARDHRRAVRFVPLEAKATAALPRGDASLHELEWHGPRVRSRAVLHVAGGECRLVALCVAGDRRALCSISFEDEEDAGWALETWRSVDAAALA